MRKYVLIFYFYTEWWEKYKEIPTSQQILDSLQLSPEYLAEDENKKTKELVLWYYDRWLPICAGNTYWGETIRYYKLPTDTCQLPNGDEKVLVTVTNEAFGLLVLENCHSKWENIFKLKDTHGKGAKIPNQGEEAKPFKAKWTKDRCGQVRFGGWKDAYPRFEELKLLIVQMRTADEANGKAGQEYAKGIMRAHHKITADVYTKKGRKQKAVAPPPTKDQRKLTRLDE